MPTVVTDGAASAKGYGFTQAAAAANYIEDVFSTYLYTANGSTQTITNGIDLSGKGGLVWIKSRSAPAGNSFFDTARGATKVIQSVSTSAAESTVSDTLTAFNANGFSLGADAGNWGVNNLNTSPYAQVSWTFRKQPKFFDVATFTTNSSGVGSFSHSLGVVPGMVIFKRTDNTEGWFVYHRSLNTTSNYLMLNGTNAQGNMGGAWYSATSTTVTAGLSAGTPFAANGTYVAYLFAHDAGGFGASGTDNVISCGSFTTDASGNASVTLGYEPQWLLYKRTDSVGNWLVADSMRGFVATDYSPGLIPNLSNAESPLINAYSPTATGFQATNGRGTVSSSYIYIAIRRGPMKTPTDATKVFSPIATTAATGTKLTTSFPVDLQIFSLRTGTTNKGQTADRLRGVSTNATESGAQLITNSTAAETTTSIPTRFWDNTGFQMPSSYGGTSEIFWNFGRAPGFFDVVCYTGNATNNRALSHSLGVAPEIVIFKNRSKSTSWLVAANLAVSTMDELKLDSTNLATNSSYSTSTYLASQPTNTTITVNSLGSTNNSSSDTFVAYLFATCPGVSKVGSYTGNGTNQTINCGFTAGARFVLIKRTDSSGDWYVWDTARGIVAANDPHLSLNSTAAEVTTDDSVDPDNSGFIVNQVAAININVTSATYIYLAIA